MKKGPKPEKKVLQKKGDLHHLSPRPCCFWFFSSLCSGAFLVFCCFSGFLCSFFSVLFCFFFCFVFFWFGALLHKAPGFFVLVFFNGISSVSDFSWFWALLHEARFLLSFSDFFWFVFFLVWGPAS